MTRATRPRRPPVASARSANEALYRAAGNCRTDEVIAGLNAGADPWAQMGCVQMYANGSDHPINLDNNCAVMAVLCWRGEHEAAQRRVMELLFPTRVARMPVAAEARLVLPVLGRSRARLDLVELAIELGHAHAVRNLLDRVDAESADGQHYLLELAARVSRAMHGETSSRVPRDAFVAVLAAGVQLSEDDWQDCLALRVLARGPGIDILSNSFPTALGSMVRDGDPGAERALSMAMRSPTFREFPIPEACQGSVLHLGVQLNSGRVIEVALAAGADLDATDSMGRTALEMADDRMLAELAALLRAFTVRQGVAAALARLGHATP